MTSALYCRPLLYVRMYVSKQVPGTSLLSYVELASYIIRRGVPKGISALDIQTPNIDLDNIRRAAIASYQSTQAKRLYLYRKKLPTMASTPVFPYLPLLYPPVAVAALNKR